MVWFLGGDSYEGFSPGQPGAGNLLQEENTQVIAVLHGGGDFRNPLEILFSGEENIFDWTRADCGYGFTSKSNARLQNVKGRCGRARGVTRRLRLCRFFIPRYQRRRRGARVSTSSPAKPYATVPRRQLLSRAYRLATRVGASLQQSLMLPPRRQLFVRNLPTVRPSWRFHPQQSLMPPFEAPTFVPGPAVRPVRVGASLPAKPYATVQAPTLPQRICRPSVELAPHFRQSPGTVSRRQHFCPEPADRPPELAPHPRQSLELPFRGANFSPTELTREIPSRRLADWEAKKIDVQIKLHYAMMLIQPEGGSL